MLERKFSAQASLSYFEYCVVSFDLLLDSSVLVSLSTLLSVSIILVISFLSPF